MSIDGMELGPGERISEFDVQTWGVGIKAVCRIPADWEITAGSSGPGGRIAGAAGHGTSWLGTSRLGDLDGIALIELAGPVQEAASGDVPATFSGSASVEVPGSDTPKPVPISFRNIALTPGTGCPAPD